jgi:predicted O-methyltransferase YrrM
MLSDAIIFRLVGLHEFLNTVQGIKTVPGWLHDVEGFTLATLAAFDRHEDTTGHVVEVGSFKGRSSCWLATGLKRRIQLFPTTPPAPPQSPRVFAVDHFTGSPEHQPGGTYPDPDIAEHGSTLPAFTANINRLGLGDMIEPVPQASLKAAAEWSRGPIRLLFIDGDHSYEASKADYEAWRPHMTPGGLIAFHDVGTWDGVTGMYKELLADPAKPVTEEAAVASLRVVRFNG